MGLFYTHGVPNWKIARDSIKTAFAQQKYIFSEVFMVDGHLVKFQKYGFGPKSKFLIDDTEFWMELNVEDEKKNRVVNMAGEFVCFGEDLFVNIYKGLIKL